MKKILIPAIFTFVIAVVLFFAIRAIIDPNNDSKPSDTASPTATPLSDQDKAQFKVGQSVGSDKAKVVLTEFGDFQCPACKQFETTVEELRAAYPDDLQFIWKHFPLDPQPHKNARVASYASEAAGNQGKFWPMHDKLYEKQDEWAEVNDPKSKFVEYAKGLNLDVDKFKRDLDGEAGKSNIDRDLDLAKKIKLGGTPSFFINGNAYDTKLGQADLKTQVEAAIKSAKQ